MKTVFQKAALGLGCICMMGVVGTSCGKDSDKAPSLTLSETEIYVYVGDTYDLKDLITDYDDSVSYTASGVYLSGNDFLDVPFNGLSFKLDTVAEFTAEIVAAKGGMQSTASVEVTVEYRSDAVDEAILATWCDPELQKTLNHDKAYLREGSNSSVKLFYAGTNTHPKGVNFNSIDGTLLDEHWSITKEEDPEKAWENAVVSFWVYNPGESALLFCPRINYAATGLDLDWKEELIQEAAPKQWTHIYFSYRALGITANFFFDEDGYFAPGGKQEDDYDANYMKVQSADAPEDGTKMYSFTRILIITISLLIMTKRKINSRG